MSKTKFPRGKNLARKYFVRVLSRQKAANRSVPANEAHNWGTKAPKRTQLQNIYWMHSC